jgi:hypothetical protein
LSMDLQATSWLGSAVLLFTCVEYRGRRNPDQNGMTIWQGEGHAGCGIEPPAADLSEPHSRSSASKRRALPS